MGKEILALTGICFLLFVSCGIPPANSSSSLGTNARDLVYIFDQLPVTNIDGIGNNDYVLSNTDFDRDGIPSFLDMNDLDIAMPARPVHLGDSNAIVLTAGAIPANTFSGSIEVNFTTNNRYIWNSITFREMDGDLRIRGNYSNSYWNYGIFSNLSGKEIELFKTINSTINDQTSVDDFIKNYQLANLIGTVHFVVPSEISDYAKAVNPFLELLDQAKGGQITFEEGLTKLKFIFEKTGVLAYLNMIRNSMPESAYATLYRSGEAITNPTRMSCTISRTSNAGFQRDLLFSGESCTIAVSNGISAYSGKVHWKIYKFGIAREIGASFLDYGYNLNEDNIRDILSNITDYGEVSGGDFTGGIGVLVLSNQLASDEMFRRVTLFHIYTESIPRMDFIAAFPVNRSGLPLSSSVPEGGIIGISNWVRLVSAQNLSRLMLKTKNGYQQILSTNTFHKSGSKNVAYLRFDELGYHALEIHSLDQDSKDYHFELGHSCQQIFVIRPVIEYTVLGSDGSNGVIPGDPIELRLTSEGGYNYGLNTNGRLRFIWTKGVTNYILTNSTNTNNRVLLNAFVDNVITDRIGVNGYDFRYDIVQTGNQNEVTASVHIPISNLPVFSVVKEKKYTNNEVVKLRLTNDRYTNKFNNSTVIWSLYDEPGSNYTHLINAVSDVELPYQQDFIFTNKTNVAGYGVTARVIYNGISDLYGTADTVENSIFHFTNLVAGEYIYPALGGRLIEMQWLPNQDFTLIVSAMNGGEAGWLDTAPDGYGTSSYMSLRTDSNGYASNFYIGYGIPGNREIVMSAYAYSRTQAAVSNLTLKYNSDFTLEDLETNSNAILTADVYFPDGDYINTVTDTPPIILASPSRSGVRLDGNYNTNNTYSDAVKMIQIMLNMVCPRKVTTAFGANKYKVISEHGIFDTNTIYAINYFINSFKTTADSSCPLARSISNDAKWVTNLNKHLFPRVKITFPPKFDEIIDTNYFYHIDNIFLYGKKSYLFPKYTNADVDVEGRDGLVEIYRNIVMRFIDGMFKTGSNYINSSGKSWYARDDLSGMWAQLNSANGQVGVQVADILQSTGVAYNYGGWDTPDMFQQKLSNEGNVAGWHQYITSKVGMFQIEHDRVIDADDAGNLSSNVTKSVLTTTNIWETNVLKAITTNIATVVNTNGTNIATNKSTNIVTNTSTNIGWVAEALTYRITPLYSAAGKLDAQTWAGIDCSGFVQRLAKSVRYTGGETMVPDSVIPNMSNGGAHIASGNFIAQGSLYYGNCYWIPDNKLSNLHRGDFAANTKHMVMVFSEPNISLDPYFNVINAYGTLKDHLFGGNIEFTRKTVVMPFTNWTKIYYNNSDNVRYKVTTRDEVSKFLYGRIVLWEK